MSEEALVSSLGSSRRIYLTGEPCLWTPDRLIRAERLPGRQGRLVFAYMVSERARLVPRDELAEVLWPDSQPASFEIALNALMSKLRGLLVEAGLDRLALGSVNGCYRLELPPEIWIDAEAAHKAVHQAEAASRAGDLSGSYAPAAVAAAILRRPFLSGADGLWVERRRDALRQLLVRALDVLVEVHTWNREPAMAVRVAEQAVSLEPFRESGYRHLMKLHHRAGDRAQALRVYERCRRLLAEELGAAPSAETEAVRAAVGY
jgi:DNA-binding SARP family transcriptional activator